MGRKKRLSIADLKSTLTEELRANPECEYVRVKDILMMEDGWTASFTGLIDNREASTIVQRIMVRLMAKIDLDT